jgi:hypothetical protein
MSEDEFDIWSVILPALAVAFTAFCVWLTVRIVNRRERWAKWTLTVTLSLPVLYVLSYGPAEWIFSRGWLPKSTAPALRIIYHPILQLRFDGPEPISRAMKWYCGIGQPSAD